MRQKLEWNKLLSSNRERPSNAPSATRNAFESDYDRIVGSSSVRRLQDKAQVFPLQENDFTRTRLTHSIEVSSLARSLGKAVGKRLEKIDDKFDPLMTEQLSALLQTAGLIHDLGNPPFGHYGETIIRQWFDDWFDINNPIYKRMTSCLKKEALLTDVQKSDFLFFDGNVQNLRIVCKLQMLNDQYGVNFTYATLATLIKYPWSSSEITKQPKSKYGYFQSEADLVQRIWTNTGLENGIRHPATFLLEAADDMAYICDDIEDGVKKKLIEWDDEYSEIKKKFTSGFFSKLFERYEKINSTMIEGIPDKMHASVLNFRNATQSFMFFHIVECFIANYEAIMTGSYEINELLEFGEMKEFIKHLKDIAKNNCFNSKEVLLLELIGDKVIKGLMNIFLPSIIEAVDIQDTRRYAGKLYEIISPNFRYISNFDYNRGALRKFSDISLYEKMQLITDYVCGMTDSFAVSLYKKLTGYELP